MCSCCWLAWPVCPPVDIRHDLHIQCVFSGTQNKTKKQLDYVEIIKEKAGIHGENEKKAQQRPITRDMTVFQSSGNYTVLRWTSLMCVVCVLRCKPMYFYPSKSITLSTLADGSHGEKLCGRKLRDIYEYCNYTTWPRKFAPVATAMKTRARMDISQHTHQHQIICKVKEKIREEKTKPNTDTRCTGDAVG